MPSKRRDCAKCESFYGGGFCAKDHKPKPSFHRTVWKWSRRAVESLLDRLDEDFGDPDGKPAEPSDAMIKAAEAFTRAMFGLYRPWACEPTGEVYILTRDEARRVDEDANADDPDLICLETYRVPQPETTGVNAFFGTWPDLPAEVNLDD